MVFCGIDPASLRPYPSRIVPDDLSNVEQLRELRLLVQEHRAAMSVTNDPDERYRLYRMVQELNACIERMEDSSVH